MIHRLCICNNCDEVMFDENYAIHQRRYTNDDLDRIGQVGSMKQLQDDDGEFFWGCPNCQTDGYLADYNENVERSVYWLDKTP